MPFLNYTVTSIFMPDGVRDTENLLGRDPPAFKSSRMRTFNYLLGVKVLMNLHLEILTGGTGLICIEKI